ncbi:rhodanese-like domain-containing protein [Rhodospirillum rubrum]|nr:rhodanese-like domain-containing protein [Rhodospirillum rubrum]
MPRRARNAQTASSCSLERPNEWKEPPPVSGFEVTIVDAESVIAWVKAGKVTVFDVREPEEFAAAHIEGAIPNPLSRFDASLIPTDSPVPVVLHCRSGVRCGHAADRLRASGFQGKINRMAGGIIAWQAAGGPVVSG